MQQHLMQMQPMMATYYPSNVTTDHIQQYLDENKSLILKIVESQNSGKLSECAECVTILQSNLDSLTSHVYDVSHVTLRRPEKIDLITNLGRNQARLQRNLMYLAAIADSQPQPPTMHSQYPAGGILQPGEHYMQHQQSEQMTPQSLMAARSSMLYGAQPYPSLQQQALHSQLGMSSGGSSGLMLQGELHTAGGSANLRGGGFPNFVRRGHPEDGLQSTTRALAGGRKQDIGSNMSAEGRGSGSDGGETLYLKSTEDGN